MVIKRIIIIALITILALSITACDDSNFRALMDKLKGAEVTSETDITSEDLSDNDRTNITSDQDEDDDADDTEKDNTPPNNTNNADRPEIRLVEWIIAPLSDCFRGTYHYEYDNQNRLIRITVEGTGVVGNSGVWDVTYPDPNTVRYENAAKSMIFTITFDGDLAVIFEGNPGDQDVYQTLEYDGDYLIKTITNATTEGMDITVVTNYIWNNGVLDTIEMVMKMMGVDITVAYDFTYGDIPFAKCSINPWVPIHQGNWYSPFYFNGNVSPYLVVYEVQDLTDQRISYRYDLDDYGCVTAVFSTTNDEEEILLYEVIYYD